MGAIGRRRLLESAGVLLAAGRISAGNVVSPTIEGDNAGEPLLLRNFEPRSMLHVRETKVLRSRYPVIDIHTHLSSVAKHRSEEHTSELQSRLHLVCRLLLEKKTENQ